jgi:gamma-glutamyltranspeptidase/glutathione hydrolase
MRKGCLNRTEEGRKFLKQAGNELPKLGDRFVQPELSQVLRNVAEHGASYMYTGDWGKHFVETVRREGGKVSLQDLAQYKVLWTEPLCTSYLGKKIYVAGMPNEASYHILTALNLAEEMKIEQQDDYWKNPAVLRDLQRISDLTNNAPIIDPKIATLMRSKNIDFSPEAQLTKDYAKAVAPMIAQFNPAPIDEPHHSNSLVVIDKDGNIAAITHTINSVCWGGTGIIVDGIPIPDSAGFQQRSLAAIKAGERLPNSMPQIIALSGNKPVFACAAIGSSMIPETIRIILGVLGKGTDLKTIQSAPPLLLNFKQTKTGTFSTHRGIDLTSGYDDSFVKGLEHLGENVKIVPEPEAGGLRGTVTAVTIDPLTGEKRGAEITNTLIFAECY